MNGERHQPHAHARVEPLHGLHQADIAFLHQIAHRQAIAEITAGDVHDESQVREHQLPRGLQIAFRAEARRQRHLVFLRQHGDLGNAIDVGVQAPDGPCEHQSGLLSD